MSFSYVCLIRKGDPSYISLVEIDKLPSPGEQITVSPTQLLTGRMPQGQQITAWTPARTVIDITANLGYQTHFGKKYITLEYNPGTF